MSKQIKSHSEFIKSALNRFEYYKGLGDKSIVQLNEQELFVSPNSESNSIAILIKHLWGNMKSRWTDFLNSDGEKSWRNRDSEFTDDIKTKAELLILWEEGWQILFDALSDIKDDELNKKVLIRNEEHSIIEAVNRQLTHYAYHIGQMVYLAKWIKSENWTSLSIPKGKSQEFNETKFKEKS